MTDVVVREKRTAVIVKSGSRVLVVNKPESRVIQTGVKLVKGGEPAIDTDLVLLYQIAKL